MTPYVYREIGGIVDKDGKKIVVPEITCSRVVRIEELAQEASRHSALSSTTIQAALMAVGKSIKEFLCEGYSVDLDKVGILTPTLRMKGEKPVEEEDENGRMVTHNARNIEFGTVKFRPSRKLIKDCRLDCKPFHDLHQSNRKAIDLQEGLVERKALLMKYLENNPVLMVKDYMSFTGLPRSTASNELKSFCVEGLLVHQGAGVHKFFTKGY